MGLSLFCCACLAHSGTQVICCIFHHIDAVFPPRTVLRMAYLGLQWHRSPSDHIFGSDFVVDTGTHGQQPCISSKCELLNICNGLICCCRADIWSGQECEPDSCANPRLHGSGQLLSGHHGKRAVSPATPTNSENPRLHGSGQLLSSYHGKQSVSSATLNIART